MLVQIAQARTWTNNAGKKVEAEFVKAEGDKVTLKLANGKDYTCPVTSLSAEDQSFIKEEAEKGEVEAVKKQAADAKRDRLAKQGIMTGTGENFFDAPWPNVVTLPSSEMKVDVIKEETGSKGAKGEYIYETPHFRFISDAKIGPSVIRQLGQLFEVTFEANRLLPINNIPTQDKEHKFLAYLYEEKETYIANGGPPTSAGVQIYRSSEGKYGKVLVPFESMGVKKAGKGYTVDRTKENKTLAHEITHQLMNYDVKRDGWFSEGCAEYVAVNYGNGKVSFSAARANIIPYVTEYGKKGNGGRGLGKEIEVPYTLKKFMNLDYTNEFLGSNSMKNYGLSALLVYYFFELDGKRDAARVKKYVEAIQLGKSAEESQAYLLDGRTWKELTQDVTSGLRSSGVKVVFKPAVEDEVVKPAPNAY